jgi:hypothetical protein
MVSTCAWQSCQTQPVADQKSSSSRTWASWLSPPHARSARAVTTRSDPLPTDGRDVPAFTARRHNGVRHAQHLRHHARPGRARSVADGGRRAMPRVRTAADRRLAPPIRSAQNAARTGTLKSSSVSYRPEHPLIHPWFVGSRVYGLETGSERYSGTPVRREVFRDGQSLRRRMFFLLARRALRRSSAPACRRRMACSLP